MIVDENGPVDPQVAYFDGYAVADRLLEGVKFMLTVKDGKLVCEGVHPDDADYMEQFSEKKMAQWCKQIVEQVKDGFEMQNFEGTEDLYWEQAS